MSTFFPKFKLKDGEPVSKDEVNENFREIIQEVQGHLGEQNFQQSNISHAFFSEDSLVKIHNIGIAYNPAKEPEKDMPRDANCWSLLPQYHDYGGNNTIHSSPAFGFDDPEKYGWAVKLPQGRNWTKIINTEITTSAKTTWVMASWQQCYQKTNFTDSDTYTYFNDRLRFMPGVQYALEIDGSRIPETTVGTLDRSTDKMGEAYAVWSFPFSCDTIVSLTPGNHVFSLVGRMVAPPDYETINDADNFYFVGPREMIIIELF